MPAVSNTSPLLNLAIIGRLDLLKEQFETITGVLGILLRARREGKLIHLEKAMDDLREKAGFHIRADLVTDVLKKE